MSRVYEATVELLETHPEFKRPLAAILAVDTENDTWHFRDVRVDPELFGEIVSRGIVAGGDGEFRLRNPAAVRAALQGEPYETPPLGRIGRFLQRPTVDRRAIVGLTVALLILGVARLYEYRVIVRDEHVVSPRREPYHNRYWLAHLLEHSSSPWSLDVLANVPGGLASNRPIVHATHWWIATLAGGNTGGAEFIAAWFSVGAAVLVGLAIYGIAVLLTADARVSVGAVFLFALTPIHIGYAGVGVLDHRIHQYLWLSLTVLSLTYLAVDVERRVDREDTLWGWLGSGWSWLAAVGFGVALACSVLAWSDPLMTLLPIPVYVLLRVVMDVRRGVDPVAGTSPILLGLGVALALFGGVHVAFGWYAAHLLTIPAVVFVACALIVLIGETFRYGRALPGLYVLQAIAAVLGLALFRRRYPGLWDQFWERAEELVFREWASQSSSMVSEEFGLVAGLVVHGGIPVILGVLGLSWAALLVWRRYAPGWLVVVAYGGVWLAFAVDTLAFVAHFAIVAAVPGGVMLVALLARFGVVRPVVRRERESRSVVPTFEVPRSVPSGVLLVAVIVVVAGASVAVVPVMGADQGYTDEQYRAVLAMEAHGANGDGHGTVVLSERASSDMYNYLVGGTESTYGQYVYRRFVQREPAEAWEAYGERVGYVVIEDRGEEGSEQSVYATLHEGVDREMGMLPAEENFQLLYAGDGVTVYAVVPGATIVADAGAVDESVRTTVEIDGEEYGYGRAWSELDDGSVAVTVAYPGTYEVDGMEVTVTQEEVVEGKRIEV